jgi:hypothetical protein
MIVQMGGIGNRKVEMEREGRAELITEAPTPLALALRRRH